MFDQMTENTKIYLSAQELQLVSDREWILTKCKITKGVFSLFGSLSVDMKGFLTSDREWLPLEVISSSPKINKGENYLSLPYVILDYPRIFNKTNVFVIRTMFWWGNFFSVTLHLDGIYKHQFEKTILKNIQLLQDNLYICVHENQWHHYFKEDNFVAVKEKTASELKKIITHSSFIKIAKQFPLREWNTIENHLNNAFEELIMVLKP